MRNLLTCAMLVASPAFAAQVCKFKGSNGEVSFMDIHFENNAGALQGSPCERIEAAPERER